MKKITITTLLLAIFICSQAQEATDEYKTSKFVLGGNFSFEYETFDFEYSSYNLDNKKSKSHAFTFKPYFGARISPNFILGAKFGYHDYKLYNPGTRTLIFKSTDDWAETRAINGKMYSFIPFLRHETNVYKNKLIFVFDIQTGLSYSNDAEIELKRYKYDDYKFSEYEFTKIFLSMDIGLFYNISKVTSIGFAVSFIEAQYISETFVPIVSSPNDKYEIMSFDLKMLPELFQPNFEIQFKL